MGDPPKRRDGSSRDGRPAGGGGRPSRKPVSQGGGTRGASSRAGVGSTHRASGQWAAPRRGSGYRSSAQHSADHRSSGHQSSGHRTSDNRAPRGTDERPARGPRDPLVEEVRGSATRSKQAAAVEAFERARELLQKGRDGAAAQAAEEAKRLAPRSIAVRELLGVSLYRAGRYRDALRELQAYRRISGRLDENHLVADSYRGLGMPEKAVPLAREAVGAKLPEETRAEAAIVGAAALADLGRFDEALSLLHRFPARRNVGRPWELRLWYVTGDVLERAGRRTEAAEEFRRIVRYDADAFDAAERLASLN